jgi:SPP1 family predicted phage head-tail adaptor
MGISRFYKETATVQRYESISDGAGYHTNKWQTLIVIKGSLDMLSGTKVYKAESKLTEYTHVFICDVPPILITPKDRIVIGNTIYNIVYVDNPLCMGHHAEILLSFNSLVNENSQESEELAFHRLYTETEFSE